MPVTKNQPALPSVAVGRFTRLGQMEGGLRMVMRAKHHRGKDLTEALVEELTRRGIEITSPDEANWFFAGYGTPQLDVQPPVGMQVPFATVAIREVAVILASERRDRPRAFLRTPIRVEDVRFTLAPGPYSDLDEPLVQVAANMIQSELERAAEGAR